MSKDLLISIEEVKKKILRSVSIVRSRTQATEFFLVFSFSLEYLSKESVQVESPA
jgi:hypothetical protein